MTGLLASLDWARVAASRQCGGISRRAGRGVPLAATLLVGACSSLPFMNGADTAPPNPPALNQPLAQQAPVEAPPAPPGGPKVGILLPLSGPNGGLGASMLRAARLAVASPGGPVLDAHDTAGAEGARQAAISAVQGGDRLILGPLTSGDTASVAPVARAANIPVLAFTSDVAQAGPGIWVMGETPEQQVRRLVIAAKAEGRTRIAALLPASGFGNALAEGLTHACAEAGLPPPTILTHGGTQDGIVSAMRQLSDYAARKDAADQKAKAAATAAPASAPVPPPMAATLAPIMKPSTLAARDAPPPTASVPLDPPPFDALLLGDTGLQLQQVIGALQDDGVQSSQVRIMGPGLWSAFASKLHAIAGAWFAAPDPQSRVGFVQQYVAAYHQSPKPLADIPYDAGAMARSLAGGGYDAASLTRADGFAGVDGLFTLLPDGHVRRSLAIFQIQPSGGALLVQPATGSANPGS